MRIPGEDTAWAQARGYGEQWGVESKLMAGVAPVEVGQVQLMDSLEHQLELGPGGLGEMPLIPLFFPGLQAQDTTKQAPLPPLYSGQSPTWQNQLPGEEVLAAMACAFCWQE